MEWVGRRGIKLEVLVEAPRRLIDGVNHDRPYRHDFRRLFDALKSIEQKSFAEALFLLLNVHCESREESDPDGMVCQSLGNALGTPLPAEHFLLPAI